MIRSLFRIGLVLSLVSLVSLGCDDSEPTQTQSSDPGFGAAPPEGVLAEIVDAFNSCPLQQKMGPVGQAPTLDGYTSCEWASLATSGIVLHEWDDTEYLPSPWIQKWEQGHTNLVSSSGVLNNWGRAGFPVGTTPPPGAGADGMLSVYVEGFTHFPLIGGIIYNTVATSASVPNVADMRCGCVGDCGDDTHDAYGGDGCGCQDYLRAPEGICYGFDETTDSCADAKWDKCREYCPSCLGCPASITKPAGVCYGFDPTQDDCASFNDGACQAQCHHCDNSCDFEPNQPISGGDSQTCSIQRDTDGDFPPYAIKALMLSTIENCQKGYAANTADCYNEVLIDVTNWTTRTAIPGAVEPQPLYKYLAQIDYLPGVIWAFEVPKQYDATSSVIGRVFTTKAWHNFNKLYENQQVPLLEFDALTEINTEGQTNPFTILCENNQDTSDTCTAVLTNAGISPGSGYFCPNDEEGTKFGNDDIGYRIDCPGDAEDDFEDDGSEFTEPCACDGCDGCCSEDSLECFTNWDEESCDQFRDHQFCTTDL